MDRDSSNRRVFLSDSEVMKRAAPGGRLPVASAKNNAYGDKAYTPIGNGTPSAVAAEAERHFVRERPDLVARRMREGK
jgi:hypothetical protein